MNPNQVVLPGAIRQDGTLELSQPVQLPPGPVEITIKALGQSKENTWAVLERIWAESKALGLKPRTAEQIDAEINALRDDSEEELKLIERIQEQLPRAME